ncbi:hypothetical protein OH77DRAFT_238271 [Trametes cingulata]|nr:hypothetical protein OH77DRAFT_238271 [Trametes cingulata]
MDNLMVVSMANTTPSTFGSSLSATTSLVLGLTWTGPSVSIVNLRPQVLARTATSRPTTCRPYSSLYLSLSMHVLPHSPRTIHERSLSQRTRHTAARSRAARCDLGGADYASLSMASQIMTLVNQLCIPLSSTSAASRTRRAPSARRSSRSDVDLRVCEGTNTSP